MIHFKGRQGDASEKTTGVSEKTSEKTAATSEKTTGVSEKTSEKTAATSEKTTDVSEKTSEKILELLKADPEITIRELASIVGISDRSIERNLQKLQKDNLVKRIGADKGGRWEVVE